MATNAPTIDLRELALRGGERIHRQVPLEIAPLTLGGLRYDVLVDDGEAEVLVTRVAGGYLVRVSVRAVVYGPCHRCLRDVAVPVAAEQEEFVPRDLAEWDPEELSPFIDDFVVDVGALARESVILALPDKLLCREECPGICPSCGGDLTEAACDCGALETDSRWDKLRELKREEGDR